MINLELISENVAGIQSRLRDLKDGTTKQPFFSAPTAHEVLTVLSDFMEKDLDQLLRLADRCVELLAEAELEESE